MQLANTDELALGGIKPKLVVDVDGIERWVHWTLAVRQKRAETIAQKQDAALLDDATDRVAAGAPEAANPLGDFPTGRRVVSE